MKTPDKIVAHCTKFVRNHDIQMVKGERFDWQMFCEIVDDVDQCEFWEKLYKMVNE